MTDATRPDDQPDSPPGGEPADIERVSDGDDQGRSSVEDTPGTDGGTSGTGGTNHRQDRDITS